MICGFLRRFHYIITLTRHRDILCLSYAMGSSQMLDHDYVDQRARQGNDYRYVYVLPSLISSLNFGLQD